MNVTGRKILQRERWQGNKGEVIRWFGDEVSRLRSIRNAKVTDLNSTIIRGLLALSPDRTSHKQPFNSRGGEKEEVVRKKKS